MPQVLRSIYIIYLITLSLINCTHAEIVDNQYQQIDYIISQVVKHDNIPAIKIEMTVHGILNNEVKLLLPNSWAGVNYSTQIQHIKLLNKAGTYSHTNDKHNHYVNFKSWGNEPLRLSYEITRMNNDNFDVHTTIIRDNLIHSPGYGLFAVPIELNHTDKKIKYTIKWRDIPEYFQTISSHGVTKNIEFTGNANELQHAIYGAGEIRLHKKLNQQQPFFIALYGKFAISDKLIAQNISQIIQSQRQYFDDYNFPYYLISLVEGTKPTSYGGTNLRNCFTAFMPHNISQTDLNILIAHEHLHNWFGSNGRIKNNDIDERLNVWWSEGFTDYYARLIAVRNKIISLAEFVTETNQFLKNYYLSPVINESNNRIKADFWHDYNIEKLPYYRGFVFALYLDNLIQQQAIDQHVHLDNVMLDLFRESKQQNYMLKFSARDFNRLVKKYVAAGIDQQFNDYITDGQTIDLTHLSKSLPLIQILTGVYERGFDAQSFNSKIIKNINIASNAYKAGLRNDDQIIAYDFPRGAEIDQIVSIKIKRNNVYHTYKYRPENNDQKLIYQLKWPLPVAEQLQLKQFFNLDN